MQNLFNRQFEMLLRVRAFGEKHSDLFAPTSVASKMFAVIAAAIPELSKNAGAQAAGSALTREGVTAKAEAREALRECLYAINQTARAIGRDQPGVRAKFRLPKSASDQNLIGAARGFAQNAEPLKDVFVAHEMSADFIQELEAAIHRFDEAIREHAEKKGVRSTATASIEDAMDRAMDAVYRLVGIVPNKVRNDYPALREWELAQRVASARAAKPPEATSAPAA